MARVFVAMSGGVDSSVTAALLLRQGHDVTGVTMRLLAGPDAVDGCCSLDGVRSAKRVCDRLGIPHYTLEFSEVFEREVVEPYCDAYAAGRTPNPCIACNDRVKFAELLRRVTLQDAEFLATGHYARTLRDADGRMRLARGADSAKDQSYFLYRITPTQLEHTMFPLGELTKPQVREIAREFGLPSAERPESQETCFVPDDDVRGFLRERRPEAFRPGPIVDTAGEVLGTHQGTAGFTVGQRRGLGLGGGKRLFVMRIDADSATVTVGPREALTVERVVATEAVWHAGSDPIDVTVRARYRGPESTGVARLSGDRLLVELAEPLDAVAPGQALVCYDGDTVVGGGTILEAS